MSGSGEVGFCALCKRRPCSAIEPCTKQTMFETPWEVNCTTRSVPSIYGLNPRNITLRKLSEVPPAVDVSAMHVDIMSHHQSLQLLFCSIGWQLFLSLLLQYPSLSPPQSRSICLPGSVAQCVCCPNAPTSFAVSSFSHLLGFTYNKECKWYPNAECEMMCYVGATCD